MKSSVKEGFVFREASSQRFYRENVHITNKWDVIPDTIRFEENQFIANLQNAGVPANIAFHVYVLSNGSIRFRFEPTVEESFTRFDVSKEQLVIEQEVINSRSEVTFQQSEDLSTITAGDVSIIVRNKPFVVTIMKETQRVMVLNSLQKFFFEHNKGPVPAERKLLIYKDPIVNGANAVGMDFVFPEPKVHLTGLIERASSVNLCDTEEPIRLFNTDAFQYEHDNPIHLYGSVPLVMAHSATLSAGIFWMNCSDTYASIKSAGDMRSIQFISETGFADFVVFVDDFKGIMTKYTDVTGKPLMPPLFTFGYHQCKWGYQTQRVVEDVMDGLDAVEIPYDAVWMDVDHCKGNAPFMVDTKTFPDIKSVTSKLAEKDRYLIRLCDPHFPVKGRHPQYVSCPAFMMSPDFRPYVGMCWPGKCSWPDFLKPDVRKWYADQYKYGDDISDDNVFIWNDMNEPSVFLADQQTFPKKLVHFNEVESRETHNIYGLLNTAATYDGLYRRDEGEKRRPFVLTRSFFAGSQRYAVVWTGDNTGSWEHMKISIDMVLSSGVCGIPFIGADVGGFFKSSPPDLIARWFQIGAWTYTFFREHCVFQARRREPFLYSGEIFDVMKNAVIDRYKMLAFFYSEALKTHMTGIPTTRALWSVFPELEEMHDITSDEVIVGEALLVAPVLYKDATNVHVVKPPGRWFRMWTGQELTETCDIDVTMLDIPVFLRGGKIVPVFASVDVSARRTIVRPITLYIALDEDGTAEGDLFLDDGRSFAYENENKCIHRIFKFADGKLTSTSAKEDLVTPETLVDAVIERIVVYGLTGAPTSVSGKDFVFENGVLSVNVEFKTAESFELEMTLC